MEFHLLYEGFSTIWSIEEIIHPINPLPFLSNSSGLNVHQAALEAILEENGRTQHPKVQGFSEVTVESLSDERFREHFRLNKTTFDVVCNLLQQEHDIIKEYFPHEYHGGSGTDYNKPIKLVKAMQITLWYLSNSISMRDIGDRFGVAKSSVFSCVRKCCLILTKLSKKFIVFPTDPRNCHDIATEFKNISGFPNTIGSIDGCHIPIICPADQQVAYRNRKCQHSVILQGICTAEKIFTDISAGYPGSMHDARVIRNSGIFSKATSDQSCIFHNGQYHLVGDSAYPLLPWLMVPHKDFGALTNCEKRYNKKLSKTRVVIENTFGLLKGRFRRLHMLDCNIDFAPYIVTACCVLHNICMSNGDLIQEWYGENESMPSQDSSSETHQSSSGRSPASTEAIAKRRAISASL